MYFGCVVTDSSQFGAENHVWREKKLVPHPGNLVAKKMEIEKNWRF